MIDDWLAVMFLFTIPALIAFLGAMPRPRLMPVMMTAGIMWLAISSLLHAAAGADATDYRFILGGISIMLGVAFLLSPLWAKRGEEDLSKAEELEEALAEKKLNAIELAEERGPSYGQEMGQWEKDRGLRTKSERAEDKSEKRRKTAEKRIAHRY